MKPSKYSVFLSPVTIIFLFALNVFSNAMAEGCTCPYVKTLQYGGNGGVAFADNLTEAVRINNIFIRHGKYIDSIQTTWVTAGGRQITGPRHGGGGGSKSVIVLSADEYINRIDVRGGKYVDQLVFYTNKGQKYGPYGGSGGNPFTFKNICVGGFIGKSGKYLDAIGVYTSGSR